MKILTIHTKYVHRGGEDEVYESEEELLRSRGHDVHSLIFDNAEIQGFGAALAGLSSPWSRAAYRGVEGEIASWRPDIVSIHNFFPLATPAVHYAAARAGIPVVQTLHNFRILCPNGLFFRKGSPCEKCLGKVVPWPGIMHACYRESHSASAAAAAMISVQHLRKTWHTQVTLFFTLTEFARQKFIQGGFPPDRLIVKPNFVPVDLGPGSGEGNFVFYAGRLSEEKGIRFLLDSWRAAQPSGRLLIAGDGPLSWLVRERSQCDRSVVYLGRLPVAEIYEYMGRARAFAFPSMMYEGMPRGIIEAFSRGTPVIANRCGSMAEIIRHKETGWLINHGTHAELAAGLSAVFTNGFDASSFRAAARAEFERHYTAERQHALLMKAYGQAIETTAANWTAQNRHALRQGRLTVAGKPCN